MITVLCLLIIFLWLFITSFLWHELGHCYEAYRQGANDYSIIPDFRKLSLRMVYIGKVSDKPLISLAGGLYSGILMLIMGIVCLYLRYTLFYISLFTLVVVQFVYGVFEWRFIHRWGRTSRKYVWGRYSIYLVVILVMGIIWFCLYYYGWLI